MLKGTIFALTIFITISSSVFAQTITMEPVSVSFISCGSKVQGFFFSALGHGPFPTVILLQGFPGGQGDVLGLGERLSKKEINVFTFNYRGTWESEGLLTPATSLQDAVTAIPFIKTAQMVEKFSIDTSKISIIGYSYGGCFAMLASLSDAQINEVATISGGDLCVIANMIEKDAEFRNSHRAMLDECMSDPSMARGLGGKATHTYLLKHRDDYSLIKHAKELAEKDILLIGGWQDEAIAVEDHILPLYRALQTNNAQHLGIHIFDCGHTFNNVRDELADCIIKWIKEP